jgi:hypothetical protein
MRLEEHGLNALSKMQGAGPREIARSYKRRKINEDNVNRIISDSKLKLKLKLKIEIICRLKPEVEIKKREEGRLERVERNGKKWELKSARGRMKCRQSLPQFLSNKDTVHRHHAPCLAIGSGVQISRLVVRRMPCSERESMSYTGSLKRFGDISIPEPKESIHCKVS